MRMGCFTTNKTMFQVRIKRIRKLAEELIKDVDLSMRAEQVLMDEDFNSEACVSLLRVLNAIPQAAKTASNLVEGYHNNEGKRT